jgi:hemerythrin-like domain-containing protein
MCDHCSCRTYPPIAELTAEHERILGLAETVADATRHHRVVDDAALDELVQLLRGHVAKEESGLYPLLIAESDQPPDAYADLEAEHVELFDQLDAGTFDHLALYALQRHIEEEEEVLFSAAVFHFDGDTWDDLDAAHRRVDALGATLARG